MQEVTEAYTSLVSDPQKAQELALVARPREGIFLSREELWEFAKQHLPPL